jgi:tRNA-dihydrouridine synthase C
VRAAVPADIPVTAKMRLGIDDVGKAVDCARALEGGGIQELVVHARTKSDGYRPPARWHEVARVRESVRIPVIANGEVWTVADYHACREATGCDDIMLGRGAVADPLLARRIRGDGGDDPAERWHAIVGMIADFWAQVQNKVLPTQSPGRLKQWLGYLRTSYPQAGQVFSAVRGLRTAPEVSLALRASPAFAPPSAL